MEAVEIVTTSLVIFVAHRIQSYSQTSKLISSIYITSIGVYSMSSMSFNEMIISVSHTDFVVKPFLI